MTCHAYHPDTHTHGLADDCPRCAEHARHPLGSLDPGNLSVLRHRLNEGLHARSENEALAMVNLSEEQAA